MSNITPLDKWSIRYEKCLSCGTTNKDGNFRHEARGLCKMCYRRLENERLRLGKPDGFWRQKGVCNTISSPTLKNYQNDRESRITKFKNFIKSWFEEEFFKKEQKGICFHHEYEEETIEMIIPISDRELLHFPNHLEEFKNCLDEYLRNRNSGS